jgi:hypothetical protein
MGAGLNSDSTSILSYTNDGNTQPARDRPLSADPPVQPRTLPGMLTLANTLLTSRLVQDLCELMADCAYFNSRFGRIPEPQDFARRVSAYYRDSFVRLPAEFADLFGENLEDSIGKIAPFYTLFMLLTLRVLGRSLSRRAARQTGHQRS